ncbi:ATP-grasp domain-containing protein [Desertivirga arenae]|uniref:ATP-grasp domain-containing protein n=1 Tax=Desertivirga arenae TaxID=2810309 RepID=UPI001A9777B6|nr:hypothetical protein [Pedobacter sp. SYSU D00823]
MKIAIHKEGDSFTTRWIDYCQKAGIPYKVVDCYASDIMNDLKDCDALMWHHSHMRPKDVLFARQLLYSLELAGKVVFPDFKTTWHFDDKVGQKYLFEACDIPSARSFVFYNKKEALKWLDSTSLPKVFKLRGGSGSSNVELIKTRAEGRSIINKVFGSGISNYQAWSNLKERYRKYRTGKGTFSNVLRGVARLGYITKAADVKGREKGYAYFQEFIPGNDSDIRVIVIDNKAFAIKRMVRENDFRASGGGDILYRKEDIPLSAVELAFKANDVLKCQCIAFDIVFKDHQPVIIEISYGFRAPAYDSCPGFWNKNLDWTEGSMNPYAWMVDLVVDKVSQTNNRRVVAND